MTSTAVTAVAVLGSNELHDVVRAAAQLFPDLALHVDVVRPQDTLRTIGERAAAADLLIIDVTLDAADVEPTLRELCKQRGADKLTLVSAPSVGLDDLRRLHRIGVFDVVPQPAELSDVKTTLAAAVKQVRAQQRLERDLAPVIAFTRAKGGMGATTLATHVMLSLTGQWQHKGQPRQVGFIDFDLQFGDAAINVDVPSTSGLLEILNDPARLDAALLRSAMVDRPEGFSMLAAPADMLPLEALEVDVAGRLIDLARAEFDVVVLDLPLAITTWSRQVLERVNALVVVTALSVSGVRRSRRLLDLLAQEDLGATHLSLVLNRYNDGFGERGILQESEKSLGRPFDFRVANDYPLIARAQDRGVPAFALKPRAKLARDIHTLADACLARATTAMLAPEPALRAAAE